VADNRIHAKEGTRRIVLSKAVASRQTPKMWWTVSPEAIFQGVGKGGFRYGAIGRPPFRAGSH